MIKIVNKTNCSGCTACAAICPENCITMNRDEEGFLYPTVNENMCIECHACERICPILNPKKEEQIKQEGYVVQNKDDVVLRESTAGGVYTALAKYVLSKNGVAYGVEFTKENLAHHISVENTEELYKFRNSKYVQSTVGEETFKTVKRFLNQGRLVVFSGTPCQIEGLKSYLMKNYDNLITMDVVCRAVPSPLILQKYIEMQEQKLDETIKTIRFRDKHFGYKYSTLNIVTNKNSGNYHEGVESDPWLRAFFSNICDRPSCHECHFRKQYRVSDITVWDAFNVGRFSKVLDNDKGATRMLIHTEKGRQVFELIQNEFNYVAVDPEKLVSGSKEIRESVKPNSRRKDFFEDANRLDGSSLFEKYFPYTMKVKIEYAIRVICLKTGIYSVAKKAYVKITKKY